jgi:hypothetical protein
MEGLAAPHLPRCMRRQRGRLQRGLSKYGPVEDTVFGQFLDWLAGAGQPGAVPAGVVVKNLCQVMNCPKSGRHLDIRLRTPWGPIFLLRRGPQFDVGRGAHSGVLATGK